MSERDAKGHGRGESSGSEDDDSRYAQALAQYGGLDETRTEYRRPDAGRSGDDAEDGGLDYRISSDPAGVRGRAMGDRRWSPWLVLLLLIVLAGWAWVELRSVDDGSDEIPLATAEIEPQPDLEPLPPVEREPVEEIELPELEASDPLVTGLVSRLTSHPEIAQYLVGEGLVRRFTAAVDNIAQGTSPRAHLSALQPKGGFATDDADGTPRPTPAAFRRYDRLTEVFLSMDSEGSAELYRRLRPLIEESYRELGYPEGDFDDTLRTAIDHLLATPSPPVAAALAPRGIGRTFEYSDERLEGLSPAQKHLMRMGPENVRRVQRKLRELRAALAL